MNDELLRRRIDRCIPAMKTAVRKTAAIYIRVSTDRQNTDTQLVALHDYASRRDFDIVAVYEDFAESGTKKDREKLKDLLRDAKLRRFDAVIVSRFDRFARSTIQLLTALEEFQALGIDFISLNESIDTSTPMGKMVFTFISGFAEFERNIIRERINAGLARARAEGKQLGRPKRIFDRERILELRKKGYSLRRIAKTLKISRRTINRALLPRCKNP